MKRFLSCIAVLVACMPLFAQTQLRGTIINAETQKGVIAASVELPDLKTGTYTDKYGNFKIEVGQIPVKLKISHIGYETVSLISETEFPAIELKPIVLHADEVLVTAKRAVTGKTPIAFTTLEREDIETLYHQQDVPMVLDMEPGVYAYSDAGNGSGYTYLNIRGFTQDRIGIMYNGVPLNDPEAHAVYWVDHGDVLNDASDIQIQRGIGNSLSSGAFGGSVNMESDISKLDQGVEATIGYGNFLDGHQLNSSSGKRTISYVGKPFPEEGISFSFRFSDLNSNGYRIGSGTDQQSAHVGFQWVQPTHMTRAEYLWGHEETNFSWDGISPQFGYDLDDMNDRRYNFYADTTYQGGYTDVNKDVFTQSIILLNHTHLLTDKIKVYGTLYHVNGSGYYQQYKGGKDPDEFNVRNFIDTTEIDLTSRKWLNNHYTGGIANVSYSFPNSILSIGGDFRFYGSTHYGEVIYVEDLGYIPSGHRFYENTTKKNSASIYIQDMITLFDKLYIQGDVRYLTHRFEVKQDSIGVFTNPYDFVIPYNFFDAHLGFRYNFTEEFSAYYNMSTSKREPSSNDLYDDSDVSVPAAVVDPYNGAITEPLIQHESLLDLELGAEFISDKMTISLNAYRMDFRNELVPIYYRYTDGDDILRGNAPKTIHQGIELAVHVPLSKFDIRANMTLADNHFVEFTADSLGWGGWGGIADYAGKTIPAFPSFQAKARLSYKHDKFQPWLNMKYIGKQYIDFMNTESSAIQPYFVADMGIRVPFIALRMDHMIDIRVNNVFNALYETFGYTYYNDVDDRVDNYWPAATRSFYLSWSVAFDAR
jgi:iron complex outermembrane recepter protein